MNIKILDIPSKHILGMNTMTSQTDGKTIEMGRSFMPHRRVIKSFIYKQLR